MTDKRKEPRTRGGKYVEAAERIGDLEVGDHFDFPAPTAPKLLHTLALNQGRKVSLGPADVGFWRVTRVE